MKMFLLLLLSTTTLFAQKKTELFYDGNNNAVSKKEFEAAKDYKVAIDYTTENDTAIVTRLTARQNFGKINNDELKNLQRYLSEISNRPADSAKIIVINYYTGTSADKKEKGKNAVSGNLADKDYLTLLNKQGNVQQYYIYNYKKLEQHANGNVKLFHDTRDIIKNSFFPNYFRYGSLAIIMPDGNYFTYLGEHSKYLVWDSLAQLKKMYGY